MGKYKYLGYFDDIREASNAYKNKAKELYEEYVYGK